MNDPTFLILFLYGLLYIAGHLLTLMRILSIEANRVVEELNNQVIAARDKLKEVQKEAQYRFNLLEATHQHELLVQASKVNKTVDEAREDTIRRSRATIRGQATEHLAPLLMDGFNPKDFRFMGNPIDYLCFQGLSALIDGSSDEDITIYLLDIKTGKAQLSKTQRRIRNAVREGRVVFASFNTDTKEFKEYQYVDTSVERTSVSEIPVLSEASWEDNDNEQIGLQIIDSKR